MYETSEDVVFWMQGKQFSLIINSVLLFYLENEIYQIHTNVLFLLKYKKF